MNTVPWSTGPLPNLMHVKYTPTPTASGQQLHPQPASRNLHHRRAVERDSTHRPNGRSHRVNAPAAQGEVEDAPMTDKTHSDGNDSRAGDWEPNMEYGCETSDAMPVDRYADRFLRMLADEQDKGSGELQRGRKRGLASHPDPDLGWDLDLDRDAGPTKRRKRGATTRLERFVPADDGEAAGAREGQRWVWIKLARALAAARAELKGEDRELFERLVERPREGVDPKAQIERWVWETSSRVPRA